MNENVNTAGAGASGRRARALLVYAAGIALILFTRALFVVYEQAHFNSDDARVGLMAKHVAELEALPVFLYGQKYMLAVEAYLAAPFFAVFGPTVPMLKLPLLLINIGIFALAARIIMRETRLPPADTFMSLLYMAAPGAVACAYMVEPGGGNIEPLLWVALLWAARERPFLCGSVAALGFLNREFVIYGVFWLAVFRIWERKLTATYAACFAGVFSAVWAAARVLAPFAPNYFGKSSSEALSVNPPGEIFSNLAYLFGKNLSALLGYGNIAPADYKIASGITLGGGLAQYVSITGFIMLAVAFIVALTRRGSGGIFALRLRFPLFLGLVGASACVSYVVFSADVQREVLVRYTLLALFVPAGMTALVFSVARRGALRALCGAAAITIAAVNIWGGAMLWREYITDTPPNPHRDLADYLVKNDIRLATADYWTAYHVTFLSGERFIGVAQERYERIREYTELYSDNVDSAYRILEIPCPGGEKVHEWYVCPPVAGRR